jgi:hypothetical protein
MNFFFRDKAPAPNMDNPSPKEFCEAESPAQFPLIFYHFTLLKRDIFC